MPRPKKDGTAAAPPTRLKLTEFYVKQTKPRSTPFHSWDTQVRGLSLLIQPSGHRSWRFFYPRRGPRWVHIGDAAVIGIAEARAIALDLAVKVARGGDPATDRRVERSSGTFAELAADYVERYASKNNKSYRQAERWVARYLLPKWGKLKAADISRSDVRAVLDRIEAPVLANQVQHAASAIFRWAVEKDILPNNPVTGIKRNATKSRERILSEGEVKIFWEAFTAAGVHGAALKLILLTGQRPGEVSCMRPADIDGDWWHLKGEPSQDGSWPGTKSGRDHKVFLSAAARPLLLTEPVTKLDGAMRAICAGLGIDNKVTPHDLRRTFGSLVTALGFGRQAMDRLLNHSDNSVGSIYDRHSYHKEDAHIMEAVGQHVLSLVNPTEDRKVVLLPRK